MCGRFAFIPTYREIEEEFGKVVPKSELISSYNMAPQRNANAITSNGEVVLDSFMWGYKLHWGKGAEKRVINTRSETITEKPIFKKAFLERRCIIPASGYYEWQDVRGKKVPYYIHPKKGLLGLAGIYQEEEEDKNFSIITTNASKGLETIHDRMPVIISKDKYVEWLKKENELEKLLAIIENNRTDLSYHIVSREVNNPKNNSPELIKPAQGTLF